MFRAFLVFFLGFFPVFFFFTTTQFQFGDPGRHLACVVLFIGSLVLSGKVHSHEAKRFAHNTFITSWNNKLKQLNLLKAKLNNLKKKKTFLMRGIIILPPRNEFLQGGISDSTLNRQTYTCFQGLG